MSAEVANPPSRQETRKSAAKRRVPQSKRGAIYRDIREYLAELERRDLLIRVKRLTNKDTEVMPLVRWQFRGLDQAQRKAWLFENLTDSRGRKFDGSVGVALDGASAQVYAAAMGLNSPQDIIKKWLDAQEHPIHPVEVSRDKAPVKEVVITGKEIVAGGGIDKFPVPVTNPGTDASAYFSCPVWITRDPETGVYNVGTYRVMLKAADRAGVMIVTGQDGRIHWEKARALGRPLEAVLCLSPVPALSLCSVAKLRQPEYEVAGALNGAPLELVKAETVDLFIPATAEIAIEGHLRTDVLEMEGPFGEYGGYTGAQDYHIIFEVSAITHRRHPILQAFISEMPPSESSCIRKFGFEGSLRRELAAKVPSLVGVNLFEAIGGSLQVLAISLKRKPDAGETWAALRSAASSMNIPGYKWIIAVNDDIDITDIESVFWAMAWRVQPHRDIQIMRGRPTDLDPSAAPVDSKFTDRVYPDGLGGSQILIDATMKWPYPPVSLPTREHMERARAIWEELGLPKLTPRVPWFGYELGFWPESWDRATKLTTAGRYLEVGSELRALRTKASYCDTGIVEAPEKE